MRNLEIIKCSCGVIFAACVEGYQDKDWDKNKREYLNAGCTCFTSAPNSFTLGSCDCDKSKPKTTSNQLQITF
jgi:hypothetical protein